LRLLYIMEYAKYLRITFEETYLFNYLTPWSRVLLLKLTGSQLVKKFSAVTR